MVSKPILVLNILLFLSAVSLSVSISAMEVSLGLLLGALIFLLYNKGIDITSDCPYFIPFFVYWIATVLPFFLGSDKAVVEGNVFDIWPILYLFVGFYFVRENNIRPIFFFIALGSLALGISVISDVVIFHKIRGDGFLGYMTGSEVLAMGAVLSFGIIVSGYEKNKLLIAYYAIACIIAVTGIIYTETRGSLISFVFASCLMMVIKYRIKGALGSLILLGVIGLGVYFSPIGMRFFEIFKGFWDVSTSHGWRFELWNQTVTLIKEYPIFGIGNGAYEHLIKNLMPKIDLPLSHAHNTYIVQLVLFGIVGLASFLWFFGKMVMDFLKQLKQNNFAFLGFFVILTFLVQGLTENNFQDSEVIMFCSFIIGILLGALKRQFNDKAY